MQNKRLQHFVLAAIVLSAVSLFDVTSYGQFANEWHVDDDAPAGGTGVDWPNAFDNLESALQRAKLSPGSDLIKVATGTYVPTDQQIPLDTRSVTFHLDQDMDNTTIKGGYRGFDLPTANLRDPRRFVTILSGDIDGDDVGFVNNGENAYHVVTFDGVNDSLIMNGFHIVGGNADSFPNINGGGVIFTGSTVAQPILLRCTFASNSANNGGAFAILAGLPHIAILYDCAFVGNVASADGGAIHLSARRFECTNCIFSGNTTTSGDGGAIFNPGGFNGGVVILTNCTLNGNSAGSGTGGAIYQASGAGGGVVTVINCILWDNSPDQIDDNNNSTTVDYSNVEGGWTGTGGNNINALPEFHDPDGVDNTLGTADDNLRLFSTSPSIDTANPDDTVIDPDDFDLDDDANFTERTPDLDVTERIVVRADMGAYECENPVVPGDADGDGITGILDLLIVLGEWGQPAPLAGDVAPDCGDGHVGIRDLLKVLGSWSPPPTSTIEEAVTDAGLEWSEDWDEFVEIMTDPEEDQSVKDNYSCWMEHYLDCHAKPFCFECAFCQICPGADPWEHPMH